MRILDNSDDSWRRYGRDDPYYGVLSDERYRAENLDPAALEEFFGSGENHVAETLATVAGQVNPNLAMDMAMDFGCGVGRLVLPLAARFRTVVGIDISDGYIAEAKRNCARKGLANVEFAASVQDLDPARYRFDLIHSCIVFNHIPWAKGRSIIARMFALLKPGGVLAIGLLHRQDMGAFKRLARTSRKFLPIHWLVNLIRGQRIFEPLMQSNEYPLDELVPLLHGLGASNFHIQPHANSSGEHWAVVYCRKNDGAP